MSDAVVFDEKFVIEKKDGKGFTNVIRVEGKTKDPKSPIELKLDVNSSLYPINEKETLNVVLATTLNLDGTPDNGQMASGPTLADNYDYVMYGKVFKFLDEKDKDVVKLSIIISFGGLLMNLRGAPTHPSFKPINLDERVYLLLKK